MGFSVIVACVAKEVHNIDYEGFIVFYPGFKIKLTVHLVSACQVYIINQPLYTMTEKANLFNK